jgi:hypothetical protein
VDWISCGDVLCGDYAYSFSGVAMSEVDGMSPDTRVPVAGRAWVLEVTSHLVWH